MGDAREDEADPTADGAPPFLGRWSRLYAVVLIALAIEIVVFWVLTRTFR
jgi:hypothetical protein